MLKNINFWSFFTWRKLIILWLNCSLTSTKILVQDLPIRCKPKTKQKSITWTTRIESNIIIVEISIIFLTLAGQFVSSLQLINMHMGIKIDVKFLALEFMTKNEQAFNIWVWRIDPNVKNVEKYAIFSNILHCHWHRKHFLWPISRWKW